MILLGRDALRAHDWSRSNHVYGPATDTPGHLERLLHDDDAGWAETVEHLFSTVTHQSSVSAAASPAALVAAGLLEDPRLSRPIRVYNWRPEPVHAHLLRFLTEVAEGTEPEKTEREVWAAYTVPPADEIGMVWWSGPHLDGYEAVIECRAVCPALVDPVLCCLTADDLRTRMAAASAARALGLVPSVEGRRAAIVHALESMARDAEFYCERARVLLELDLLTRVGASPAA